MVLAKLVNILTDIYYENYDIQEDLVNLGILSVTPFDSAKHTDDSGGMVAGDPFFEFTEYGRGLVKDALSSTTAEK